jgi:hypothetical protein
MFAQLPPICIILLFLSFCLAGQVSAQQDQPNAMLTIHQLDCQLVDYPWWPELHLYIRGYAHPICAKGVLTVAVFFGRQRVKWCDIVIPAETGDNLPWLPFEAQLGPLNNARQFVASGDYQITVELLLDRQNQGFQAQWKKYHGPLPSYKQKIVLGSETVAQQEESVERQFYIVRMQKLNHLFNDLEAKKKEAFSIHSVPNNQFADQNRFSADKWARWLERDFFPLITAEQSLLERHQLTNFFCRYPVTQQGLETYAKILRQLATIATQDLSKAYQQKRTPTQLNKMARQARDNISKTVEEIQKIHGVIASEMNISLRKELGYLPPFKN